MDVAEFDRFEAAGWGARAAEYDRFFVPLTSQVIEPLLDAAGVGAGTRTVDLASGPGHVTAACAARGADVVGVDIAPEMVAVAQARHPDLLFRQADAQALPFPDTSMDAVLGNFVILHVGRPERVAVEAARVLSPGGRLALSTWDVPASCRLIGVITDAVREAGAAPPPDVPEGPPFFRFADEDEFVRLLTGAGLKAVGVRTVAFRYRSRTAEELWDGMIDATVRTRALVLGQSDEMRARIREAFDRQVAQYATADGLDIPVSVKVASGVRP